MLDLTPSRPLATAHAAAAIIATDDGRYLLQHRDAKPTIFYPDHWGCFGGALEPGESPMDALRRELSEELGLEIAARPVRKFGHFRFSVEPAGIAGIDRHYFEVRIDPPSVAALHLGEGTAMRLVDGRRALHELRLVPYDGFALWLHYYKGMLLPP